VTRPEKDKPSSELDESSLGPARSERSSPSYTRHPFVTELEARKIRHDPSDLITRAAQPLCGCWFSARSSPAFARSPRETSPTWPSCRRASSRKSVLFISIFYGIAIIWERDLGIVHKFLVSPTPRRLWFLARAFRRA